MTSRLLKVFYFQRGGDKGLTYVGQVALKTYDQFLMSQLIEAVIIGSYGSDLAVTYFGLPYGVANGYLCRIYRSFICLGPMLLVLLGAFLSSQ